MADKYYNLQNIQALFTKGFTVEELCEFPYVNPDFRPVFRDSGLETEKAQIINLLIKYAEQKGLLEPLLAWAETQNPIRYFESQPYSETSISPKSYLIVLRQILNSFERREAEYQGHVPRDLLNRISTYKKVIVLTERVIAGTISETDWLEALKPLKLALPSYNLKNVHALLTEGFSIDDFYRFYHYEQNFRPFFDRLTSNMARVDIIDRLLEYAYRVVQINAILAWAKEENPSKYEKYQPYYEPEISFTEPSEPTLFDIIKTESIVALLDEGFTASELHRLTFLNAQFRPVWEQLIPKTPKAEIIDRLLKYTVQTSQIDTLISLVQAQSPARYESFASYFIKEHPLTIGETPFEAKGVSNLRLDAAVPNQVTLGRVFDLAVSIRQPSSPVLDEKDLTQVRSGDVQVSWPEGETFIRLRVQVSVPECGIHGENSCSFWLYKGQDSPIYYFQLTPKKVGEISIVVTVYQEGDRLGSARIHTIAHKKVVGKVQIEVTSHPLAEDDTGVHRPTRTGGFTMTNEVETRKDGIRKLIIEHQRRLQILKEQQAKYGISVDPRIPIEIQDIEAEVAKLQAELNSIGESTPKTPILSRASTAGPINRLRQIKIKNLEARLEALVADYEAASNQLNNALSEVDRTRLKRQVEVLEQEISQVEAELNSLR